MREILPTVVGIFSIIAVILSLYTIVSEKIGARKKELDNIKERLGDHEGRIRGAERVTETIEDFMDELLVESLRKNRNRGSNDAK